jgi:hypothetical protein
MKTKIFFILLIVLSVSVKADAWDNYLELLVKYQKANSIKGAVSTRYFFENNSKPTKVESGSFVIDENRKRVDYENVITLNNDKYNITLDNVNKFILLKISNSKEEIEQVMGPMKEISKDSLVQLKKLVQMEEVKEVNGNKRFELVFPKNYQYKKIVLLFTKDGVFQKMIYEFNKENEDRGYPYKIEIAYTNLLINTVIDIKEFSEKNILVINGDNVKPIEKYSTYKILDYRKFNTNSKK